MIFSCYLPDAALLAGAVYRDGAFHLYAIDPAQLQFAELDGAGGAESPLTVDSSLADNYWLEDSGAPVAENLQQARQYADTLETRYGVRMLVLVVIIIAGAENVRNLIIAVNCRRNQMDT